MSEDGEKSRVTYLEVLKNKYFLFYTIADFSTVAGSAASSMAFILLAFGEMGQIGNVGYYRIAIIIPTLILGLVVGVYVDRWGKKRSYIITSFFSALVILIPIFYRDFISIITVVLVLTSLGLFRSSSHQGILPLILDEEQLRTGNSVTRMAVTGATIATPTLAIFTINYYGFWILFVFDSLTYILDLVCLYYIPLDEEKSEKKEKGVRGVFEDIKASFGYVKGKNTLALIFISSFFFSVIAGGFVLYVLEYADILYASRLPFGYFKSANGAGAFIGGFITGKYLQDLDFEYIVSISFLLVGLSFVGLSLLPLVALFVGAGVLFGSANSLMGIGVETGIQSFSDEEFLGRISSLETVVLRSGSLVAIVVAVLLIKSIGVTTPMLVLGTILIISSVLLVGVRRLGS